MSMSARQKRKYVGDGSKLDSSSERKFAEDVGSDGFGKTFDHPEFPLRVVYDGDRLARSRGDLVIAPFKVDGVAVVDPPRGAQAEVEIEQWGWRTRPDARTPVKDLLLPDVIGHFCRRPAQRPVLACDFHLQNLIRLLPVLHPSVGEAK